MTPPDSEPEPPHPPQGQHTLRSFNLTQSPRAYLRSTSPSFTSNPPAARCGDVSNVAAHRTPSWTTKTTEKLLQRFRPGCELFKIAARRLGEVLSLKIKQRHNSIRLGVGTMNPSTEFPTNLPPRNIPVDEPLDRTIPQARAIAVVVLSPYTLLQRE